MPKTIEISNNKTLKLTNVLMRQLEESEFMDFGKTVIMMEEYIKAKGYQPIGPLIQHSSAEVDEEGKLKVRISLLRQSNNYINHVESPYMMESILRVRDCLYTRFTGEESHIKHAYDKLTVTAYEEDIALKGSSYTIFVNMENDQMVADIFMERLEQ
ncbi:MAG: hypothetical protein LBG97_09155 [Coriobacteriales bacterium]|jgi:effector-binding domain-containing protein|nr:hypothetical protein [Coriobacteriales bacterium]